MAEIINFANNERKARELQFLIDIYNDLKVERDWLNKEWDRWENIWRARRDIYKYEPIISEVYIPIVRKKTEDAINDISNKLFPYGDNFVIYPMPGTPDKYAEAVKKLLQYQFFEEMKVPVYLKTFLRELIIKGTAVMKLYFEKDCIKLKVIDLRDDFYVYPSTAETIDEALIIFHRKIVDKYELERMAKIKKYINIDGISEISSSDVKENLTNETYLKQYKEVPYYEIIECFIKHQFDNNDKEEDYIVSFTTGEKRIIQITPSPFYETNSEGEAEYFRPYLSMPFIRIPNSFYGHSIYSQVQHLQYLINDYANLMLDNAVLTQNPIVKVDPARIQNLQSIVLAPGAMWQCEPDAVVFDRPPSLLGEGLATFNALKLLCEEYANIGGFMPMTTKRTTATEVAMHSQMMSTFIASAITDIETQMLTPLLQKSFLLDKLFLPEIKLKKILGHLAYQLNIKDNAKQVLEAEYGFRWIGTIQSTNLVVKSQQLINLLQMLGQVAQAMPQNAINFELIIREAWRCLGNTNIDDIIIKPEKQIPRDPQEENELMSLGKEVDVNPEDNDQTHIGLHNAKSVEFQDTHPTIFNLFVEHIRKHIRQMQQKVMAQQQMMAQQMMAGMQQPQQQNEGNKNEQQ